ncbi:unnamed protein product [Tenebrio molitor]|nr:unnamed protein product [Tenebrio molitor]
MECNKIIETQEHGGRVHCWFRGGPLHMETFLTRNVLIIL